ncbi:sigma-70 family RNA polymerase sigma factor [Dyella sp. 333MFSha]|uniref:sigma-70 family RNA polymerase sigma factor n=1 Tax=Dyella sp. 333MFSha TaxID=1798240 RepID=UPI0008871D7B|nr:sigma-70 family RNA polymerase sigma factor [Dyella sp. 333MFSha]SDF64751.1 RNA polymerase sigma-70 factor, ECF subfamily [Dyella sp. 333MFSha]
MYAIAPEHHLNALVLALTTGFKDPTPSVADDDATLMHRYRHGDVDAFRELYGRYHKRLHRYLLRLANRAADAEEVFQDVWAAVIRGRSDFRAQTSFASWLFAIAHRRAADRFRLLDRHAPEWRSDSEDEAGIDDLVATDAIAPERVAHSEALGVALLEAIAALPPLQREAFLLKAEGELTLDQIASITGTSRETVKSRLRYAQVRLRKALEAWQ